MMDGYTKSFDFELGVRESQIFFFALITVLLHVYRVVQFTELIRVKLFAF